MRHSLAWFQASAAMYITSLLFWDVTQGRLVVSNRRFGKTYRSHLQGSSSVWLYTYLRYVTSQTKNDLRNSHFCFKCEKSKPSPKNLCLSLSLLLSRRIAWLRLLLHSVSDWVPNQPWGNKTVIFKIKVKPSLYRLVQTLRIPEG
jgi:hypothetical protein